jgi:ketosteroid isomerase-like protein
MATEIGMLIDNSHALEFHAEPAITRYSSAIHVHLANWFIVPCIGQKDGKTGLSKNFDQIAIVVDWLDACRAGDLEALLDLYAQDASLECACNDRKILHGRADLTAYWGPRLRDFSLTAFGLKEITPAAEGVVLDYSSFEGKPVRVFFAFDGNGRILQTRCEPSGPDPSTEQDR